MSPFNLAFKFFSRPGFSRVCKLLLFLMTGFLVFGCSNNDSDTDEFGYVQFYNASPNSPQVSLQLDDSLFASAIYSEASARGQVTSGDTALTISWDEDSNNEVEVYDGSIGVTDSDITLVVLAGDFADPDVLTFKYAHDTESLSDETDEDNFALRVLNVDNNSTGVDVYLSDEDETFNEAILVTSVFYSEISEVHYQPTDGYKIYLTEPGSNEPLYESDVIYFYNNDEYVLAIRSNNGSDSAPYTIDMITSLTAVTYPPINAQAEVRFYNGLTQHELLPQLNNSVDIELVNSSPNLVFENLHFGSVSNALSIFPDDYAFNIYPSGESEPIAKNHFLTLRNNQSQTIFLYHTEVS